MSDLKLQGSSGVFGKEQPVQIRKLPSVVNDAQLKGMTKGNNLDEIVVEDQAGDRHIVYADELSVKDGQLPKVGDKVNLAFLDEQVKVIHVDDEVNEDRVMAGMSVFGLTGLAATRLAGGSLSGSDNEIKRLSHEHAISQKELNWAKEVQAKQAKGQKPSDAEHARANEIISRHAQQQKIASEPCKPGSKVSLGELVWALDLAKRAQNKGQRPNAEEAKRYETIYQQLRKENPAPQVPQKELDWALQLEQKVKTTGYTPTDAELARYNKCADDLIAQSDKDKIVLGLVPTADLDALRQEDIDWARALQRKIDFGYKPSEDEFARYEDIFNRVKSKGFDGVTVIEDPPSPETKVEAKAEAKPEPKAKKTE